jgi:hypothetical protein
MVAIVVLPHRMVTALYRGSAGLTAPFTSWGIMIGPDGPWGGVAINAKVCVAGVIGRIMGRATSCSFQPVDGTVTMPTT